MAQKRVPSCPKCGTLPESYSEYCEQDAPRDDAPAIVNTVLVRLSWHCSGCGMDVDVSARNPVNEPEPGGCVEGREIQ